MATPLPNPAYRALDVTVMLGCNSPDRETCLPAGHCLSRARLRHLRESDWVVSRTTQFQWHSRPTSTPTEVRVVHELLLDRTLTDPDAVRVTEVLLSALEMVAYDDGVRCLTFLLCSSVVMGPFEQRGYTSLVLDSSGVWLQRKFGWLGWSEVLSVRPN